MEMLRPIQPWKRTKVDTQAKTHLMQVRYLGTNATHTLLIEVDEADKPKFTFTEGSDTLKLAAATNTGFTVCADIDALIEAINASSLNFEARRKDCEQGYSLNTANVVATATSAAVSRGDWQDAAVQGSAAITKKRFVNYDLAQKDMNGVFAEKQGMIEFKSISATGLANSKNLNLKDDSGNVIATAASASDGTTADLDTFLGQGGDAIFRGPLVVDTDSATGSVIVVWRMVNR